MKDSAEEWRLDEEPARTWARKARERKERRQRQASGQVPPGTDEAINTELAELRAALAECQRDLAVANNTVSAWQEYWGRVQQADEHHRDADAARSAAAKKVREALLEMDRAEELRLQEIAVLREALAATQLPRDPGRLA